MNLKGYKIARDSGVLSVSGPAIEVASQADWTAREFGPGRVLLQSEQATKYMLDSRDGNAWCPVDAFTDFIFGIHHRQWSGVVTVDTGFGVKKLFFSDGEVVFAGTNVIDDRLGEILYRQGMLSLEHLMDASVQVGRGKKFGQVLINSGIFSNLQLWKALQCQVRELFRSVFMSERIYFEMHRENGTAPTEVVFTEGSHEFLESCYGYGCMYRDFVNRLGPDTFVSVKKVRESESSSGYKGEEGTFASDLIGMIGESKSVRDILDASKLLHVNTLAAIMMLVNQGRCEISPLDESKIHIGKAHLAGLRAKLDIYAFMLTTVVQAFEDSGKSLPLSDLRSMARELDERSSSIIYLNDDGHITQDAIERIFSQCKSTHSRAQYYAIRIDCLVQFLLQLALDHLNYDTAKSIRQHYRKLVL